VVRAARCEKAVQDGALSGGWQGARVPPTARARVEGDRGRSCRLLPC